MTDEKKTENAKEVRMTVDAVKALARMRPDGVCDGSFARA